MGTGASARRLRRTKAAPAPPVRFDGARLAAARDGPRRARRLSSPEPRRSARPPTPRRREEKREREQNATRPRHGALAPVRGPSPPATPPAGRPPSDRSCPHGPARQRLRRAPCGPCAKAPIAPRSRDDDVVLLVGGPRRPGSDGHQRRRRRVARRRRRASRSPRSARSVSASASPTSPSTQRPTCDGGASGDRRLEREGHLARRRVALVRSRASPRSTMASSAGLRPFACRLGGSTLPRSTSRTPPRRRRPGRGAAP